MARGDYLLLVYPIWSADTEIDDRTLTVDVVGKAVSSFSGSSYEEGM